MKMKSGCVVLVYMNQQFTLSFNSVSWDVMSYYKKDEVASISYRVPVY